MRDRFRPDCYAILSTVKALKLCIPFIVCILSIPFIPYMYSIDIYIIYVNKNGECCRRLRSNLLQVASHESLVSRSLVFLMGTAQSSVFEALP